MGTLACAVDVRDVTERHLAEFFRVFRNTAFSTAWDLTDEELLQVAVCGAPAVLSKYGLHPADAARIENGGKLLQLSSEAVARLLRPPSERVAARWKRGLGLSIGGNHFIEVQRVAGVRDERAARAWGLGQGQLMVMYHGGGGPVAGFVGRYFGNRSKDDMTRRVRLFLHKLRYHFGDLEGLRSLIWRLQYFSPKHFRSMPEDIPEGRRLIQSMAVGMNYGYAYRMAIASRIVYSLEQVFGQSVAPSLVYDSSHNSIQKETVGGRDMWIHRHNTCKVEPDKPLLVPGHYYASSFLAARAPHSDQFLNSAPHGLGELVTADRDSLDGRRSSGSTLVFTGWEPNAKEAPHMCSPRLECAFERMESAGLLTRVVDLEPVAVLKQFRGGSAWRQQQAE
jgi:tRNA-splicing ligase RtcB